MASYGFGLNNKGWNESKKGILAKALSELVDDDEGKFIGITRGQRLYVLVDEPSRGVIIMNTTYLTKEFQHDLIKRANKKYHKVMLDENSEGYVLSKNI
ncbi:MAG TPA: hypothetical protein VE378_02690 [Nitrososphaeraceae archaeon]|nr:hypothetical protein [Nitrososphaeraceae archaeon]